MRVLIHLPPRLSLTSRGDTADLEGGVQVVLPLQHWCRMPLAFSFAQHLPYPLTGADAQLWLFYADDRLKVNAARDGL